MVTGHSKDSLVAFEKRIEQAFLAAKIAAPVHLSGGNEGQLLEIFEHVQPGDWLFSTWRSHYHLLLKGVPEAWLYDAIVAGRSMYLCSKEHKVLCSSIVGGILPLACGVALGAKRLGLAERVWVFVGDMAARTGIFHEFEQYCRGHGLPVSIVVEDNGLSTNTPTVASWGAGGCATVHEYRYSYRRQWPHVGCGQHVTFG